MFFLLFKGIIRFFPPESISLENFVKRFILYGSNYFINGGCCYEWGFAD